MILSSEAIKKFNLADVGNFVVAVLSLDVRLLALLQHQTQASAGFVRRGLVCTPGHLALVQVLAHAAPRELSLLLAVEVNARSPMRTRQVWLCQENVIQTSKFFSTLQTQQFESNFLATLSGFFPSKVVLIYVNFK
jgi:hypothetical protein